MQRGDWMLTVTGRRLYVGEPKLEDILVEDIAHALAKVTRFGGHTPGDGLYSVAQHSVLVSIIYEAELQKQGIPSAPGSVLGALLHDATEAYLGDMIRPVKRAVGRAYGDLEHLWERAITQRFGLSPVGTILKHADLRALATERRDLLPFADPKINPRAWEWKEDELGVTPWFEHISPMSIPEARAAFLTRFDELGGVR